MTEKEMITKLEQMEDTIRSMIAQLRGNKELSPIQNSVRVITSSKSSNQQVKKALQFLIDTPQCLSVKQVAFITHFGMLNKPLLGQDIDSYLKVEIGKRRYNERTSFIEQIQEVLDKNYNSNRQFKEKLLNYLDGLKKK